jgi:ABC-2 type transport system permease protein
LNYVVKTFAASFKYTLKNSLRYLSAGWFIGIHIFGPLFFLLTSWTIYEIIGQTVGLEYFVSKAGVSNYLAFAAIGFAFLGPILNASWAGAEGIRSEQEAGTLELIFVTPSSKIAWLIGKMMAAQTFSLISLTVILVTSSVLFGLDLLSQANIAVAILGMVLTMIGMSSFSFALAGLTFVIKRTQDLNQFLWPTMTFFCGLAFPIEVLPPWAQAVSWIFPLTHGINITRKALLVGAGIFNPAIATATLTMIVQILIFIPIGLFLFKRFYNMARKTGSLFTY